MKTDTTTLIVSLYRENRIADLRDVLTDIRRNATQADVIVSVNTNFANTENDEGRHLEALRLHLESVPFIEKCNDWNRGNFNHSLAYTFKKIADLEGVEDYYDRALVRYEEAGYYFEKAGRLSAVWSVQNNLACIQIKLKRPAEAHAHLDKATEILNQHGGADKQARLAEVCDTRALAYEAQGQAENAFYASLEAQTRAKGSNEPRLIQSLLTTHVRISAMYLKTMAAY